MKQKILAAGSRACRAPDFYRQMKAYTGQYAEGSRARSGQCLSLKPDRARSRVRSMDSAVGGVRERLAHEPLEARLQRSQPVQFAFYLREVALDQLAGQTAGSPFA